MTKSRTYGKCVVYISVLSTEALYMGSQIWRFLASNIATKPQITLFDEYSKTRYMWWTQHEMASGGVKLFTSTFGLYLLAAISEL